MSQNIGPLKSSPNYKFYATVTADVDLTSVAVNPFDVKVAANIAAGLNSGGMRAKSDPCIGFQVFGQNTLVVVDIHGNTVTITNAVGFIPIRAKTLVASGTTATSILVMWEE